MLHLVAMLALAFTILSTTSIGVIIKLSESRVKERLTMLLFNYIVATIVSLLLLFTGSQSENLDWSLSKAAWILGPLGGFIFALNFFLMIMAIKKRGVALPVSLMRLSAIVPVGVSIIFLSESPGWVQVIGMIGALVAAVMMSLGLKGGESKTSGPRESNMTLVISSMALLLCFGLGDLDMKLFEEFGRSFEKPLFLAVLFGSAGLCVLIAMIVMRVRMRVVDVVWGLGLGVPNYFSSWFTVQALEQLPSYIVFPVVTSVTVVLIALIGKIFFREEIGRLGIFGIILTIGSVIAISI